VDKISKVCNLKIKCKCKGVGAKDTSGMATFKISKK